MSALLRKIPSTLLPIEVILVENGSSDGTAQACQRLQQRFPQILRVESLAQAGYGRAIKQGILQSRSTYLVILECDCLDTDFAFDSLDRLRNQNARFVVASKRHAEAVDERPWMRRSLTHVYNRLLRVFLGYPGTDTHGLKAMETNLGKQLCQLAVTSDEVFQTEIVLLAWRLGVDIVELPLNIRETRPAPVKVVRRIPKVWKTILELRRSLARFPDENSTLAKSPLTNLDSSLRQVVEAGNTSDADLLVNTQWK